MRWIISLLLLAVFYACDFCGYGKCSEGITWGQFRIIRATDSKDLLFGRDKIYDKANVRFYALKGSDTTYFISQSFPSGSTAYDSILYVDFFPVPDTAYIRLGNGDIDTLKINAQTYKSRCCGKKTNIVSYRFNNATDIPGRDSVQVIRK